MTMDERMKKGYLWTDTGEYLEEQARAKDLMYDFNHTRPSEEGKRNEIIKELFGSVGDPVWIMQPITSLARGKTVHIGSGTYINSGLTLIDDYEIHIGENCLLATNVTLCTTGHPVHLDLRSHGEMYSFPVKIGNGVWIGSNVVVLPGVTIGDNTVIGAGSVVTKDIPANVVAVGNPCKVLRPITDRDKEYYYHDLRVDMQE
ncbi:MAG: DapH/DapD/GlmU-related protein [Ruminococcus sp.]|nr:DapH/DapD/GlmU-related protein [Ruminococcus sp.]